MGRPVNVIIRPQGMNDEAFFIYCCQLLSVTYNVPIEVDYKNQIIDIQTSDEMMIQTIVDELQANFMEV